LLCNPSSRGDGGEESSSRVRRILSLPLYKAGRDWQGGTSLAAGLPGGPFGTSKGENETQSLYAEKSFRPRPECAIPFHVVRSRTGGHLHGNPQTASQKGRLQAADAHDSRKL
jgi:hypothetical protein